MQRLRTLPVTLFLTTLVTSLHAATADRPNVVVLVVDNMGYAGPSNQPYGILSCKTPGIGRLAAEGMCFTEFHLSRPVCPPIRAGDSAQTDLSGKTNIVLDGKRSCKFGIHLRMVSLAHQNPAPAAQTPVNPQLPPLLRPLERPEMPAPAFTNGFVVDGHQTIVILGSTNALECGRHGYLETLVTAAYPQYQLRFRNMAWQADTVYQQQRPRNFYVGSKPDYGERDGRNRVTADIVFFWLGQTESLEGRQNVKKFADAYSGHLSQLARCTARIVLVTPVPFSDPLHLGLDIEKRNQSLAAYVDAIKRIGHAKQLPVVDLFSAFKADGSPKPWSRNGLHLSASGHWFAAQAFARQLGFAVEVASVDNGEGDSGLQPPSIESLRQAIGQKNELWFRYWRPTNWAFLYGNRQTQPSSRDHRNATRRWFPEELQTLLPHIEKAELAIHIQAVNSSKEKQSVNHEELQD